MKLIEIRVNKFSQITTSENERFLEFAKNLQNREILFLRKIDL